MRLRILASARRDLEDGYRFYESQDQGVGDYFLASVRADFAAHKSRHAQWGGGKPAWNPALRSW